MWCAQAQGPLMHAAYTVCWHAAIVAAAGWVAQDATSICVERIIGDGVWWQGRMQDCEQRGCAPHAHRTWTRNLQKGHSVSCIETSQAPRV